jgi:two-component system KDP operon response regulator KdpE
MTNAKIIIVDDEEPIRKFLRVALTSKSYMVFEAASGQEALANTAEHKPDLVILDLGLPDLDGIEVTRLIRQWTQIPIIILSVRDSERDKIAALDAGADDYLTKPFGIGELFARIRSALRRSAQIKGEPVFTIGSLKVDLVGRLVTLACHEVMLTPNEYDLLRVFVIHAGKVLTYRFLLSEVWGTKFVDDIHMLQVNISNLRHKIEPEPARPQLIITEQGVGYRLKIDQE